MTSITRQSLRSTGLQPALVVKNICIDRSGSMDSFNGKQYEMTEKLLLDTWKQQRESSVKTSITLKTFDTIVTNILYKVDPVVQDTPSLQLLRENLYPRGMTRLNDTILESLKEIKKCKEEYLNSLSNEVRNLNPKVVEILVVITDGQDNESSSSKEEIKKNIIEFREQGGEAILMAANMDAEKIGIEYGFDSEQCLTVHNSDQTSIENGFDALTTSLRTSSAGVQFTPFTQYQRQSSLNTPNDNIDRLQTIPMPPLPIIRQQAYDLLSQEY